jgi:hypothetical protein
LSTIHWLPISRFALGIASKIKLFLALVKHVKKQFHPNCATPCKLIKQFNVDRTTSTCFGPLMDNSIPYLQYFMDNFSDHQPLSTLSTRMAKAQKSACAFKRCFKIEKDDQFMQGVFQQKGSKFIPMIMIQIPHVCKT